MKIVGPSTFRLILEPNIWGSWRCTVLCLSTHIIRRQEEASLLSPLRDRSRHTVSGNFLFQNFFECTFVWLLHQKTSWKSSTKWVTKKGPIHCTWNVDRVEIKCKTRALNLIKQLNFIYSLKLALLQLNKEKFFKKLCSCQCLVDFKQFLSIFNDNIFVKSHLYRFCYLTHSLGLANVSNIQFCFPGGGKEVNICRRGTKSTGKSKFQPTSVPAAGQRSTMWQEAKQIWSFYLRPTFCNRRWPGGQSF